MARGYVEKLPIFGVNGRLLPEFVTEQGATWSTVFFYQQHVHVSWISQEVHSSGCARIWLSFIRPDAYLSGHQSTVGVEM